MLIKKKHVNPQENSLSSDENEIADNASLSDDDDDDSRSSSSMSSEEPEWTDDEVTGDIKGDLLRVRRRTLCGTAGYRPPEQVGERYVDYANRNGYDERVDFFSLGVTVFAMVCGRRPFPTKKQMMQSQQDDLMKSGVSSPSRRRSSISDQQRAATRKSMKDIEFQCEFAHRVMLPILRPIKFICIDTVSSDVPFLTNILFRLQA